jgi:hypothetical protein
MLDLQKALLLVMKHSPNLEIFVVDWPMGSTFGPVADALAHHAARSLRTIHWQIPSDSDTLAKVIWALDSLPYIVAAHIHFTPILDDSEDDDARSDFGSVRLGMASNVQLNLRYLQQLSLKGNFQELLEQATGWSLRALRSVSFDYGNRREELPNILAFVQQHGTTLRFLDIKCIPMLDVSKILDACPNLNTFAFNPDWRIMPNDGITSELVRVPHFNITTIGLHGLYYAFGVGHGAAHAHGAPITAQIIQKSNDMNVAALNKLNFPKLECVRVLSPVVLRDLEQADGPSEDGARRYDKWWNMLSQAGIRLEDCTGAPLGTLPQVDSGFGYGDEEESGDEEWEADAYDSDSDSGSDTDDDAAYQSAEETFTRNDGEDDEIEVENELDPGKKHATELRRLLDECRMMDQTREAMPYTSMMGVTPGASVYSGELDYGTIYQSMTGNGTGNAPPNSSSKLPTATEPGTTFGYRSQPGGRRPRVSFGISDEAPDVDEPAAPSRSGTISRRSSGRYAPRSRNPSSNYTSQSHPPSSFVDYTPSDAGTLIGLPEASPAISTSATLVDDDDNDDDYDYDYDEDYDSDGEEVEHRHPVATLRELLAECKAMRESAEEPMFNPMMFNGGPGFNMAPMSGPGLYGGVSRHPSTASRSSYHSASAYASGRS